MSIDYASKNQAHHFGTLCIISGITPKTTDAQIMRKVKALMIVTDDEHPEMTSKEASSLIRDLRNMAKKK